MAARRDAGAAALLAARAVTESYGGIQALKGVDFAIRAGEVHAIVGENGAGKSTLTMVLSGVVAPDGGKVLLEGRPVVIGSPAQARALGIAVVHQELELADALSVGENLFLGRLPGRGGLVGRRALRERSQAALDALGRRFGPDTPVRRLSVAERQGVEIARALIGDARVVFLDEPTTALSPVEAEGVHDQVRRLRNRGVEVAYIPHNLDDVVAVADRVSVMRDGRKVAEVATGGDTLTFDSRPLMELGGGQVLGVPWSVLVVLAVLVVCQVVATRTTTGRTLYAVGANPRAARLSGINLAGCRFWVFVASGAAAGLAGVPLTGQAATAVPSAGVGYELLGSTSLRGGEGSVLGTLTGVLIIGVLNNGMTLLGVGSYYQMIANGVLLLMAVGLDQVKRGPTEKG